MRPLSPPGPKPKNVRKRAIQQAHADPLNPRRGDLYTTRTGVEVRVLNRAPGADWVHVQFTFPGGRRRTSECRLAEWAETVQALGIEVSRVHAA